MRVSNFLGVPNAQINDYVQKLSLYQRRKQQGHEVSLPEMPAFTFSEKADVSNKENARRDSLIARIDEQILQWQGIPEPKDDQASQNVAQDSDSDSNYRKQPKQSCNTTIKVGEPQQSELAARGYSALILEDALGATAWRTEKGDPMSVKTYGWRLVRSTLVANPHLIIPVSKSIKRSIIRKSDILYIGISDGGVEEMIAKANLRVPHQVSQAAHHHPQKALAYSVWQCDKPYIHIYGQTHDPRVCICKVKTKQLLVCATAVEDNGGIIVVPVRVDSFLWQPDCVNELKAYAEFARQMVKEDLT
jgi:hypothetical protein